MPVPFTRLSLLNFLFRTHIRSIEGREKKERKLMAKQESHVTFLYCCLKYFCNFRQMSVCVCVPKWESNVSNASLVVSRNAITEQHAKEGTSTHTRTPPNRTNHTKMEMISKHMNLYKIDVQTHNHHMIVWNNKKPILKHKSRFKYTIRACILPFSLSLSPQCWCSEFNFDGTTEETKKKRDDRTTKENGHINNGIKLAPHNFIFIIFLPSKNTNKQQSNWKTHRERKERKPSKL